MNSNHSGRNRLASLIAGSTLSAASLLGASLARADTTITRNNGTRTTFWSQINTGTTGTTTSEAAIRLGEGEFQNTRAGDERDDAFDGALRVFIGPTTDTSSSGRVTALMTTPPTVVDNSPNGGSVSGTATTNVGGQDIGVDFTMTFESGAPRVVGNFVVTNNSGSNFDGYVAVYTNFGSDSSTQVEATSSGDTNVATGDTWVVSSQGGQQSPGSDPIIISASPTPGILIGPDTDMVGDDDLVWRLPLSLAPGGTATVSASHCLVETIATAVSAAQSGRCPDRVRTPVPVMQNPALLALAVLTGLLGAGHLRRRRREAIT